MYPVYVQTNILLLILKQVSRYISDFTEVYTWVV